MDLNQVAVFAGVVEAGSFTRAAHLLGIPKSTVSRRVSALEDALGVRLLQRTTRKLSLTDAGAAYYERVSRALSEVGAANSEVSEMQDKPRGRLRVTAPVDFGETLFAKVVAEFVVRYPEVQVDVVLTGRAVDLVAEGFDLAVRAGRLRDSTLIARKLGEHAFWLTASPEYLQRHGTPRKPTDLANHDFVLFRARDGKNQWTLRGPKGVHRINVSGSVAGDDLSFVRAVAHAGGGVGVLPSFVVGGDIENGSLVRVLPRHYVPGAQLNVVYPSARYVPRRVQVFRDYLLEALGELLSGR